MIRLIQGLAVILSLSASLLYNHVYGKTRLSENLTIDNADTVVFDLSKAVINGNNVYFPISILSDDTILSLDFSFKYNQMNLIYDSLVKLNNYMQTLAFYNANDSTLRFSSNSPAQPYSIDSGLVLFYFNLLSTQINPGDLDTPKVYLNGAQCSYKITLPAFSGINDHNSDKEDLIIIFPNPASESIKITAPNSSRIQMLNSDGRYITSLIQNENQNQFDYNIKNLPDGIYFVNILSDNHSFFKKLIVNHQ